LVAALAMVSLDATHTSHMTTVPEPSYVPGEAALRATIDTETGDVVIGPARVGVPLDAATREAVRSDEQDLEQVYHANGAVSVHLRGRHQNASIARIGQDGKVIVCTDNEDAAAHALHNAEAETAAVE